MKKLLVVLASPLLLTGCGEPAPVEELTVTQEEVQKSSLVLDTLYLKIKPENFEKIKAKRAAALKKGNLVSSGEDYVGAKATFNGESRKVKLRLKGDLPDHWQGARWSYRIKVKKQQKLFSLRKFSLQDPATRNFVWEWLFHKHLKEAGLMGLRYRFVYVVENGVNKGVYAVEEHFNDDVLKDQGRTPGAVVSFEEGDYWVIRQKLEDRSEMYRIYREHYLSSGVRTYSESDFEGNAVREDQVEHALEQLQLLQQGQMDTSTWNVKNFARFIALCDVYGAFHSYLWGNMRFGLDATSNKLEPIGFDGDAGFAINNWEAYFEKNKILNGEYHNHFHTPAFVQAYIAALEEFTADGYLESFLNKHQADVDEMVRWIQMNDPDYQMDVQVLYENRAQLREALLANYFNEQTPFVEPTVP